MNARYTTWATVAIVGLIANTQAALSQLPNGYFTNVMNLGPSINGPFREANSSISHNGLTLFFESNRTGGLGDDDLYMATRASTSEPFGEPINLVEVNSPQFDRGPRISVDGLTLYFLSARPLDGTTSIWVARRSSTTDEQGNRQPFDPPTPVDEVNSASHEAGPFLSFDELTLYFISNRPGGHGTENWDIWKAERAQTVDDSGNSVPFGTPTLLGGQVNSNFHELSPHTSSDELTLFFCDWKNNLPYRTGGLGAGDIWFATRSGTAESFGAAMNPGEPINTIWNESHPNISPQWPADGSILYFDSIRPEGYGVEDLWQATWVVSAPTPPGDYNGDGTVDAADYVVWRKGLGATYTPSDYDVWRSHFGQTAGSGAALRSAAPLSAGVPELATGILSVLGAIAATALLRDRHIWWTSQLSHGRLTP